MKKLMAIIMVIAVSFSLAACGNKAFDTSKEAYDKITIAYDIVDAMGADIYEAWRLGIYDDDEISVEYLCEELNLTEEELTEGIVCTIMGEEEYFAATDEEKAKYRDEADYFFYLYDDVFTACVIATSNAYVANGKVAEAETALDESKNLMKTLSEKHSDYEHYPNLKGYYTTTSSFFDFCCNPSGSFEQVKGTINDYRNEARDFVSDLDYIFEE